MAQGVQQPYEISVVTAIEEAKGINLSVSVYPNPTTDYLTLSISEFEISNLSYHLYDINGKLLQSEKITGNQTSIVMSNLVPANYFVKVVQGNKEVKMLKETIEHKNRELVSKALILTSQKEKNTRLAQKLKKVDTKQVNELKAVIDELQTEDTVYLKEFQIRFNEVHQNFYTNLKADFTNLTTGELKLAAFLKLQLSSKEIAILTNTTKAGINVSRSRLRKKLKMENKDNFIDFLERY